MTRGGRGVRSKSVSSTHHNRHKVEFEFFGGNLRIRIRSATINGRPFVPIDTHTHTTTLPHFRLMAAHLYIRFSAIPSNVIWLYLRRHPPHAHSTHTLIPYLWGTSNNRMKFMLIENLFRINDDQFIYVSCRCHAPIERKWGRGSE